ncbi:hypothetical protein [Microbacterium album]|uniref:Uncharacterized protein n=1 Tax=Microbacterium album TaxID=2053191 RepID=A0A917IGM6_9MICO|nr:hypothetical protein [Microbacterium album]GGH44371.1 hypothetical protein GCM10010921_18980 [Microbacterium album]
MSDEQQQNEESRGGGVVASLIFVLIGAPVIYAAATADLASWSQFAIARHIVPIPVNETTFPWIRAFVAVGGAVPILIGLNGLVGAIRKRR